MPLCVGVYLFRPAAIGNQNCLIRSDIENVLLVKLSQQFNELLSFFTAVAPAHESDVSRLAVITSSVARIFKNE